MQLGGKDQPVQEWSLLDWGYQYAAAAAYGLRPKRIKDFVPSLRAAIAHRIMPEEFKHAVPDGLSALPPDGFAGVCPDLSVNTLMAGYHAGLYQTSHAGPYKWWAPEERMVLFMDKLKLEKNLRRKLRQGKYKITFDTAFNTVVASCAGPREQRRIQLTWITPPVQEAFERLHAAGHAHSVEVWDENGTLAGGLFGVGYGHVFATESQFAIQRDASKIAFSVLNRHLQSWGYVANDLRRWTPHLEKFGGATIPHGTFRSIVSHFGSSPARAEDWAVNPDLCTGNWEADKERGWAEEDVMDALVMAEELRAEHSASVFFEHRGAANATDAATDSEPIREAS